MPGDMFKFIAYKPVGVGQKSSAAEPISITKLNQALIANSLKHDLLVSALKVPPSPLTAFTVQRFDDSVNSSETDGLVFPVNFGKSCDAVLQVAFTSDDEIFLAIIKENNSYKIKYYATNGLLELGIHDFGQVFPTIIRSNPCSNAIAACMSDGSLQIWTFDNQKFNVFLAKQLNASCVSWSPKGKQLLVGCLDGKFVQVTPAGEIKRVVQNSPDTSRVLSIVWIATYHFICAYDRDPELAFYSVTLHKDPNQAPVVCEIADVIMSCFDVDPKIELIAFIQYIPEWKVLLCSSSKSSEIGVIAYLKNTDSWECLMLDENARAQFPVPANSNKDPLCISLALSFCSQRPIGGPVASADGQMLAGQLYPVLFAMTHFGKLHAFSIAYNLPDVPVLNVKPSEFSNLKLQPLSPVQQSSVQPQVAAAPSVSSKPVIQSQPSLSMGSNTGTSAQQVAQNSQHLLKGILGGQPQASIAPPLQSVSNNSSMAQKSAVNVTQVPKQQADAAAAIERQKQLQHEAAKDAELNSSTKKVLQSFSAELENLKLEVGNRKPMGDKSYAPLHHKTLEIEKFKGELKLQLDSLIHDVQELKNSHLHTFNVANRAKVFLDRHNDERYQSFLKSAPLPPDLQKLADSIQNSEGFIQLRANEILAMIENVATRERKMKQGEAEYYDTINTVLQNNYKTIMALGQKLDEIAAKYDRKFDSSGNYEVERCELYSKRADMSTLDINCSMKGLNLSSDGKERDNHVSFKSTQPVKNDPEKVASLRDFLSRRTRAPVTKIELSSTRPLIDSVDLKPFKPIEDESPRPSAAKESSVAQAVEIKSQAVSGEDRVKMLEKLRESVFLSQQPPSDKDAPVVNVKDLNIISASSGQNIKPIPANTLAPQYQQPSSLTTNLSKVIQNTPPPPKADLKSIAVPPQQQSQSNLFSTPTDKQLNTPSAFVKPMGSIFTQGSPKATESKPANPKTQVTIAEKSENLSSAGAGVPKHIGQSQKENSAPANVSIFNVPQHDSIIPSGSSLFGMPSKPTINSSLGINDHMIKTASNLATSESPQLSGNVLALNKQSSFMPTSNIAKSASSPSLIPPGQMANQANVARKLQESVKSQVPVVLEGRDQNQPQPGPVDISGSASILKSLLAPSSDITTSAASAMNSLLSGNIQKTTNPMTTSEILKSGEPLQTIDPASNAASSDQPKLTQSELGNMLTTSNVASNVIPVSSTASMNISGYSNQSKSSGSSSIFNKPATQNITSIFPNATATPVCKSSEQNQNLLSFAQSSAQAQVITNIATSSAPPKPSLSLFANSSSVHSNPQVNTAGPNSSAGSLPGATENKLDQPAKPSSNAIFSSSSVLGSQNLQMGNGVSQTLNAPVLSSSSIFGIPAVSSVSVANNINSGLQVASSSSNSSTTVSVNNKNLTVVSTAVTTASVLDPSAAIVSSKPSGQSNESGTVTQPGSLANLTGANPTASSVGVVPPLQLTNTTSTSGSISGQSTTVLSGATTQSSSIFGGQLQQNSALNQTPGGSTNGQISSPFGQNTPVNNANKSLFATPQTNSPFGSQTTGSQLSTSVFGHPANGTGTKPADAAGSLFGGTAFSGLGGTPQSSQQTSNVFGSLFGSSGTPATTSTASPFSSSAFSSQAPQSQNSIFGGTQSSAATGSLFGSQSARSSVFGSSQPSSGAFGSTTGGSVFGQTGQSPFGASNSGNVFGKSITSPSTGQSAFGAAAAFGGSPGASGAFGSSKPVFGSTTSANPAFGGGAVFGSGSSSVFGGSGAGAPSGGSVFGAGASTGGLASFGGLASGMGSNTGSLFGNGGAQGMATGGGSSAFGSSAFGGAMSGSTAFGGGNNAGSFSSWR